MLRRLSFLSGSNLALVSLLTSGGCAVGPDFETPQTEVSPEWRAKGTGTAEVNVVNEPVKNITWWESFNDPVLNTLVADAARQNLDLQAAYSRIRQARAERGIAASGLWPSLNSSAAGGRERLSQDAAGVPDSADFGGADDFFRAGVDAAWELDIFGGIRRGVEAADADARASVDSARDTLVSVVAEVAATYLELRTVQLQLSVAGKNVEIQTRTVELTRSRFEGGLGTQLDVARSEAQLSNTKATIPAFEASVQTLKHALAVLLGRQPAALETELAAEKPLPVNPPQIPAGVPSELLRRRPDIRRAENDLAAATARIGVAKADWFPRFSLTGTLGTSTREFASIGEKNSLFWSVGPTISWPIFQGGRIVSNITVQEERQIQAVLSYHSSVLRALREVEDALVRLESEQASRRQLEASVQSNEQAVRLANELYDQGLENFLSVLDAEEELFLAESLLARSKGELAKRIVTLYKALGGGWESQSELTEEIKS